MKKQLINLLKSLLISVSSLIVGFIAISLPFNLFDNLSSKTMQIIFLGELIIYSIIFSIFFLVKESKKEKESYKRQQKKIKEKRRIQLLKDLEQFNMAA